MWEKATRNTYTFYFILFLSSLDILKMLFTYGGFQMLRLNPSKVVLLVRAEDSSTTKHTIVLFVEQCINKNNIIYEGGVYVRKPACMFLHVFFVVPWPTWRCHRGLTIILLCMHVLPVLVYQQKDFTTGVNLHPHDILWWYHINKYRATRGNWIPEWTPDSTKVTLVSCKHPLTERFCQPSSS